MEKFARCGTGGSRPEHTERDLHRVLNPAVSIKPYQVRIPIKKVFCRHRTKSIRAVKTEWVNIPFVFPWLIIKFVQDTGNFKKALHGKNETVRDFWADFKSLPYTQQHHIQRVEGDTADFTPVHIHVDGVKIFKGSGHNNENTVYSFSGALVKGTSLKTKYIIGQLPVWLQNSDSNAFIVFFICWLLKVLATGETPRRGYYRETLIPPDEQPDEFHRALFVGLKTDAKEKVAQHRYQRNHNCRFICEECFATTTGILKFTDFTQRAPHRRTRCSHETYLETYSVEQRTPWCCYDQWRLELHRDDPQHILYNDGVASVVVGGAVRSMCLEGCFGPEPIENQIRAAYEHYLDSEQATWDSHMPKEWTVRRFKLGGNTYPAVAGSYKHGHVRAFLHWCAHKTAQHVSTPGGRLRHLCVSSLSKFVLFLDKGEPMLKERDRQYAHFLGTSFLDAYSLLYAQNQVEDVWLWGARPKAHQLDHIIQHLKISRINPLWQWSCWQEEDLMGKSAKITKRVHPSIAGLYRALQRYIVHLHAEYVKAKL